LPWNYGLSHLWSLAYLLSHVQEEVSEIPCIHCLLALSWETSLFSLSTWSLNLISIASSYSSQMAFFQKGAHRRSHQSRKCQLLRIFLADYHHIGSIQVGGTNRSQLPGTSGWFLKLGNCIFSKVQNRWAWSLLHGIECLRVWCRSG